MLIKLFVRKVIAYMKSKNELVRPSVTFSSTFFTIANENATQQSLQSRVSLLKICLRERRVIVLVREGNL